MWIRWIHRMHLSSNWPRPRPSKCWASADGTRRSFVGSLGGLARWFINESISEAVDIVDESYELLWIIESSQVLHKPIRTKKTPFSELFSGGWTSRKGAWIMENWPMRSSIRWVWMRDVLFMCNDAYDVCLYCSYGVHLYLYHFISLSISLFIFHNVYICIIYILMIV